MQRYEITAPFVMFHSGALQLTEEQARVRKGFLTPTKEKGVYLIDLPTGFKKGEILGFDGEMNRQLAHEMVEKTDKEQKEEKTEKLPAQPAKTPQPKKWTAKPT